MAPQGGQASAREYFSRDLDKIDRAALPPLRRVGGPSLRVFPIAPLGPAIFHLIPTARMFQTLPL